MIELLNVSKKIKKKDVLTDITMNLDHGKCYLLSGHNGSGKTMLLRIIANLMSPSSGKIVTTRNYSYGVIIENPTFLKHETVFRNLELLSNIQNTISKKEIDYFLSYFHLDHMKNQPVKKLSLGMNQRLALCQAFMEDQDVILLDEPFNALDSENIENLIELIHKQKKDGKIIVIAAHNLSREMENIFDHKYTLSNGSLI